MQLTLKSFLGFRVLANVNRLLFLRVLHVTKLVIVSLPFEEKIADLLEPIVCCIMKSSPLSHVLSIDIGSTS